MLLLLHVQQAGSHPIASMDLGEADRCVSGLGLTPACLASCTAGLGARGAAER